MPAACATLGMRRLPRVLSMAVVASTASVMGCGGAGDEPVAVEEAVTTSTPVTLVPLTGAVRRACVAELGSTYCSAAAAAVSRERCEAKLGLVGRAQCPGGTCLAERKPLREGPCRSGPTYPTPDACGTPVPDDCSFYRTCVEARVSCGESGYALGFGERLCYRFLRDEARFSAAGQTWLRATRRCLQAALASARPTGCAAIQERAYAAHAPCYLGDGAEFCDLPAGDLVALARVLGTDLLARDALVQMYAVAAGCARRRLEEILGLPTDEDRSAAR